MNVQEEPKVESKLIWLLFMHRHGDRAPVNMAPKDKYNNIAYWPEGFGNLVNAGRRRMFRLGKYIRRRYEGFLTDNIREVYSRSSDVERCIESAHAVLAGLYPPSERFYWDEQLNWIPAPVHTVPAPDDYLLNEEGRKYLTEYRDELRRIQNSEVVKELYEGSLEERELLERELGCKHSNFLEFISTDSTLRIEESNNLPMPAWYTPELKGKLRRFAGTAFALAGGGTEKVKKNRSGELMKDILSRMDLVSVEGPPAKDKSEFQQPTNTASEHDYRKVVHYSTHDLVLISTLQALNLTSSTPDPPGFGATFFIELYVDLNENGDPISEKYLKLFYLDDTESEEPIEKKPPNCLLNEKAQFTVDSFRSFIDHLLPDGEI